MSLAAAVALAPIAGCSSHSSGAPPSTTTNGAPPGGDGAPDLGTSPPTTTTPPQPNPITQENALPGDPGWPLLPPAPKHELEGYGSRITVHPGDAIDVAVNV
ncbi:MAG: hypothetical protein ACXVCV_16925, partial [Polyangia bacterium]